MRLRCCERTFEFRRRPSVGWIAVAVAASCLPLAACSDSKSTTATHPSNLASLAATAVVRDAADETARAGTSHVRTVVQTTSGGTTTTVSGTGLFNFHKGVGEVVVQVPRGSDAGTVQEVITSAVRYVNRVTTGAAHWSAVAVSQVGDGDVISSGSTSPAVTLDMLRGATSDVRDLGETSIRDVSVVHYRGTLDLTEAAAEASGTQRGALTTAARALGGSKVPFDAYIDTQGRLRRFTATYSISGGTGGSPEKVVSTTELSDFGAPVTVRAPGSLASPTPTS